MRILLTTDTVGGVWTYAIDLARALAPRGVSVALATMGDPPNESQRRQAASLPDVVLFPGSFKLEWMNDPWDDLGRAGDWLLEVERQFRPDVVHLNGYAHGALPWRSPVIIVGHSCVLSWWRAVKGADAPGEWDLYREAVTRGLRAADLVVAPSHAMLDALRRHYGPLPTSRVIYNCRDPRPYRRASRAVAKEPIILSAGRLWDEAKNVAALDRVAPRLPWPVYVAGESRHPDAAGASAQPNVVPLGRLDEAALAGWFARAAVYAMPARYEPFGLSPLEAALSGCALILGDIPSLREVWGDAAEYVRPGDDDALERALCALAKDAPRRQELARLALGKARRYAPGRMAAAYEAAYRELLVRGTRSRARHESQESRDARNAPAHAEVAVYRGPGLSPMPVNGG